MLLLSLSRLDRKNRRGPPFPSHFLLLLKNAPIAVMPAAMAIAQYRMPTTPAMTAKTPRIKPIVIPPHFVLTMSPVFVANQ